MNRSILSLVLCILASVFFVISIVLSASGNELGTTFVPIGSLFLVLGITMRRKSDESKEDEKSEDNTEEKE